MWIQSSFVGTTGSVSRPHLRNWTRKELFCNGQRTQGKQKLAPVRVLVTQPTRCVASKGVDQKAQQTQSLEKQSLSENLGPSKQLFLAHNTNMFVGSLTLLLSLVVASSVLLKAKSCGRRNSFHSDSNSSELLWVQTQK